MSNQQGSIYQETETENQQSAMQSKRRLIHVSRVFDSIEGISILIGSCLLLFAAGQYSFHWYIRRIWGATGRFWQSCWNHIYKEWFHENELIMTFLGPFIVTTGIYWLANALFILMDTTGCPKGGLKYKVQKYKQVEMPQFLNGIGQVLYNQFIVGVPIQIFASLLCQLRGCPVGDNLPTFHWMMFEIFLFSIILEITFYYSHRLLHQPKLYKYIHKRHHEWTAPTGIMALYAHPIEYAVGNILPTILGPLIMGSHLATFLLWVCLALLSTTIAHCGYHLPFLPSPEAHDFHHLNFNQNFGAFGVLDRLHGTDSIFRHSLQYKRHFTLLSSVPVSQQYPDLSKVKPD